MSIVIKISKNDATIGEIEESLRDSSSMSALLDSLRAAKTSTNSFITHLVESDKAGKPEAEIIEATINDDGMIELYAPTYLN